MSDYLDKISKLLNQAENAGTQEEAAVFMAKAQELATAYSVDLARARHITKSKEKTVPIQRSVKIGLRGDRGRKTLVNLYLGIASANDIRCLISHDSTVVYGLGFAEDLDVTEALFASLQVQMTKFSEEYKSEGSWKQERVTTGGWYENDKPITWITARLNFQQGFANQIRSRLWTAQREEQDRLLAQEQEQAANPHLDVTGNFSSHFVGWFLEEHGLDLEDPEDNTSLELTEALRAGSTREDWIQELVDEYKSSLVVETSGEPGMELVLASKKEAVDQLYTRTPKGRGSYNGSLSGASSSHSHRAGGAAANRASLGSQTSIGGSRKALGA